MKSSNLQRKENAHYQCEWSLFEWLVKEVRKLWNKRKLVTKNEKKLDFCQFVLIKVFIFQLTIMTLMRLATAATANVNIREPEMATLPLHPSVVQQVDMKPVPLTTVLDSVQALVVVYERVTYDTLPPTIAVYFYNEWYRNRSICSFKYSKTYLYSPYMSSQKRHLPQSVNLLE